MTVSLQLAKDHLRIRHNDQDTLITSHIASADGMLVRFVGDDLDVYADELIAAQLLVIEWLFRPDDAVELDEVHQLPRAVVALAGPYRTPTVA